MLLSSPNPDDPLNNEAANLWKSNEKEALKIGIESITLATEYTQKYAKWTSFDIFKWLLVKLKEIIL